jgi:hypothetical protein
MQFIQSSLKIGRYAFTLLTVLFLVTALYFWSVALSANTPMAYGEAMTWTVVVGVSVGAVMSIEYAENKVTA